MKEILSERLVTVFPRQGRYAHDPANLARYLAADVSVDHIGDLLEPDFESRLGAILETT
jgi:putative hydrolase of the HAD superfamily